MQSTAPIKGYNALSRWRISNKAAIVEKLNQLVENDKDLGVNVIKALIEFKYHRKNSNIQEQEKALLELNEILTEINSLTLQDLKELVKNRSYIVKRTLPKSFKKFLINLSPDTLNEIINSFAEFYKNENIQFLKNSGIKIPDNASTYFQEEPYLMMREFNDPISSTTSHSNEALNMDYFTKISDEEKEDLKSLWNELFSKKLNSTHKNFDLSIFLIFLKIRILADIEHQKNFSATCSNNRHGMTSVVELSINNEIILQKRVSHEFEVDFINSYENLKAEEIQFFIDLEKIARNLFLKLIQIKFKSFISFESLDKKIDEFNAISLSLSLSNPEVLYPKLNVEIEGIFLSIHNENLPIIPYTSLKIKKGDVNDLPSHLSNDIKTAFAFTVRNDFNEIIGSEKQELQRLEKELEKFINIEKSLKENFPKLEQLAELEKSKNNARPIFGFGLNSYNAKVIIINNYKLRENKPEFRERFKEKCSQEILAVKGEKFELIKKIRNLKYNLGIMIEYEEKWLKKIKTKQQEISDKIIASNLEETVPENIDYDQLVLDYNNYSLLINSNARFIKNFVDRKPFFFLIVNEKNEPYCSNVR